MDRQAVIKQLENLREHCEEMIDKDDPECIWRSDTEALTEAIRALSLDKTKIKRRYKYDKQSKSNH